MTRRGLARVRAALAAATLAATIAGAGAAPPGRGAPPPPETVAIVGATVYATPDQRLDGATVVIAEGRIAAVGVGVTPPPGARIIDGAGKVVTAGLVEAHSQLGLVLVELEPSGNDGVLGVAGPDGDAIHASYRAQDGFDADAVSIPVARAGGVTSVVAVPSGGLVAGQSAWFALADGADTDDAVRPSAAMHAALGADGAGAAGGSRGRALEMLAEVLEDAAVYGRTRAAYDRNASRELAAGRLDLAALGGVLRGTLPLVVTANAEQDIRAALRLARERGLRLVIAGGSEAWKVAEELAAAKVPVIVDPTANLPERLEAPDVRDDNAAALAAAGVTVAISTLGDGSAARTIRQLAGNAVAEGLPWARALAALTTVPAAIYGVTDRGTVTRGAVADVVVWSGDPLELTTRAEAVFVGGVPQSLRSRQVELRDRYR